MTFGILVDSAHDLLPQFIKQTEIEVVPTKIFINNHEYRDYFDITSHEFVQLINQGYYPKTSQPAPGEYFEAFERLAENYNEILAFSISSKLSGTYQSMVMAANEFMEFEDVTIHAFDTLSVSMGSGIQVLIAAKLRDHDQHLTDVLPIITQARDQLKASILFYSLEYLRRGGRISRTKEVFGKLMNMKPIISIIEGLLVPTGKARGWEKGVHHITQDLVQYANSLKHPLFILAHYNANEAVNTAEHILSEAFSQQAPPVFHTLIGPTLLSHTGPKLFGAGVLSIPDILQDDFTTLY